MARAQSAWRPERELFINKTIAAHTFQPAGRPSSRHCRCRRLVCMCADRSGTCVCSVLCIVVAGGRRRPGLGKYLLFFEKRLCVQKERVRVGFFTHSLQNRRNPIRFEYHVFLVRPRQTTPSHRRHKHTHRYTHSTHINYEIIERGHIYDWVLQCASSYYAATDHTPIMCHQSHKWGGHLAPPKGLPAVASVAVASAAAAAQTRDDSDRTAACV